MQTEKIKIYPDGRGRDQALAETMKYAAYNNLEGKKSLRLQLLTEETINLVEEITGDFKADFWIETSGNNVSSIHLLARTNMDYKKRNHLIDVSTRKKVEPQRGFMGKIREIFENYFYTMDEISDPEAENGCVPLIYGSMDMLDTNTAMNNAMIYKWSLDRYRNNVDYLKDKEEYAAKAWDELEKSIVGNIADDVRVYMKGDQVELIIEKAF